MYRRLRQLTLVGASLAALRMSAQPLSPPLQNFLLHFATSGVGYTTSISLGLGFTMECWVSLESPTPFAVIMGKANNPRGADPFINYAIGLDDSGTMLAFVQTTGQAGTYRLINAPSAIPLHKWTHVAAVLDSGVMKLYVNGQLVASGPSPGPPGGTTVPFAVGGAIPDGTAGTLCCSAVLNLRQARVWSRALSPAELQSYAVKTLTGNETGLLADWPLDDGSGSPRDLGPQHLPLTLAGSASWMPTAVYDAGPYWDFQPFQTTNAGGSLGTVLDMGGNGMTVLIAKAQSLTAPNGVMAFRWTAHGFADVTSTVFPDPGIQTWTSRDWAVADFDGDGRPDAFLAAPGLDQPPWSGGQSRILIQSADGKLVDETDTRLPAMNGFTHSVTAADIDGDGAIDLYVGNICCGAGPQLYINDGSGHFTAQTAGLPDFLANHTQTFTSARFIDVNNDGSPDLVLGADQSEPTNLILLNDGHGNFTVSPQPLPPKAGGPEWITVAIAPADYDGDGYTDLILVMTDNYQGPIALQLLLNNGDGTFRDASSQIPQNWLNSNGQWLPYVVPCDINGDGWIDFITPSGAGTGPHLFINQGQGWFVDATAFLPAGGETTQIYVRDFDGDGRADIFFDFFGGQYGFARNLKAIMPAQDAAPGRVGAER
jgi:hypothetical protein